MYLDTTHSLKHNHEPQPSVNQTQKQDSREPLEGLFGLTCLFYNQTTMLRLPWLWHLGVHLNKNNIFTLSFHKGTLAMESFRIKRDLFFVVFFFFLVAIEFLNSNSQMRNQAISRSRCYQVYKRILKEMLQNPGILWTKGKNTDVVTWRILRWPLFSDKVNETNV